MLGFTHDIFVYVLTTFQHASNTQCAL